MAVVNMRLSFHRLTDLAAMKLTTFYGEEDNETLENVLHNVPNIVPRLSISSFNNVTQLFARHSQLTSISEHDDTPTATVASVSVTIQPDKDGAYVNPAVSETPSPDSAEVFESSNSAHRNIGSQVIVQNGAVNVKDSEPDKSDGGDMLEASSPPSDVVVSSLSLSSSSSSSTQEDEFVNSTLRTFLRRVSDASGRSVSALVDGSNKRWSLPQVS